MLKNRLRVKLVLNIKFVIEYHPNVRNTRCQDLPDVLERSYEIFTVHTVVIS